MATQPTLTPGGWVQINATTQSPLAPKPSPSENTVGLIRQIFNAQGKQYFQVVWNPGNKYPTTGLYTCDELTPIDQKSAANIVNSMNQGGYNPFTMNQEVGQNYKQPNVPAQALPPGLQNVPVTPTLTGPTGPLNRGADTYQ